MESRELAYPGHASSKYRGLPSAGASATLAHHTGAPDCLRVSTRLLLPRVLPAPAVAPAVGTTVPGGATVREGHLVCEMLHDSGLVTSMDLVELNPFLDERGRTAQLMVDLCASAMGRRVFDRPTRAFG